MLDGYSFPKPMLKGDNIWESVTESLCIYLYVNLIYTAEIYLCYSWTHDSLIKLKYIRYLLNHEN